MIESVIAPEPYDDETKLVGLCLKSVQSAAQIFNAITPKMLSLPRAKVIYEAALKTWADKSTIDIISVSETLRQSGELDMVGGRSTLIDWVESASSRTYITPLIEIVRDAYLKRELMNVGGMIVAEANDEKTKGEEILVSATSSINDIMSSTTKNEPTKIGVVASQIMEEINHHQTTGKPRSGIVSGFIDLDAILGSIREPDLVIVAGRPAMGKTAFLMSLVRKIAQTQGRGIGVFSLEMSKRQLTERMVSDVGSIPSTSLQMYKLDDSEWQRFAEAQKQIDDMPIWIDDTSSLSTTQLRARAQRMKMQHGVSVFVVDYLQLMTTPKKTESRQLEITDISAQLKSIAKDTNSIVFACSQLSRLVEHREGKRPQLADLRDSGSIEQDADIVLMLYRPEYYLKPEQMEEQRNKKYMNLCEVIVSKHREGPTGTANLTFMREYSRFLDRIIGEYPF